MGQTRTFCDHCGDELREAEFKAYASLPFDVDSAFAGESGIICLPCDVVLGGAADCTCDPKRPYGNAMLDCAIHGVAASNARSSEYWRKRGGR